MDLFDLVENNFSKNFDLRVLTDLKTSAHFGVEANLEAKIILSLLKKINFECLKNNKNWRQEWIKKAGFNIKKSGLKEWFSGRSSVPFKAILGLESFCSKEDYSLIKENCNYFCTKTSSLAKFPRGLSPDLAWLVAAILCDGHLRKNGDSLAFEVSDLALANVFSSKINNVFESKGMKIREINRIGRNTTYMFDLSNKPVCHFFNKIFKIPFGKKCAIIEVPELIKNSTFEIKKAFLKGVFDTDGGKRGGGLGLTSLSEKFVDDVSELLKEFEIVAHKESWLNKKYQKKCFGSRFKIDANSMFLIRRQNEIVPKNNAGVG
jgi:hypothetical protein